MAKTYRGKDFLSRTAFMDWPWPWAQHKETSLGKQNTPQQGTFGRADDDNGPGLEPPPHDRKRCLCLYVHYEPPAVSGGRRKAELSSLQGLLSLYLDDACRFEPRPLDLREGDLHDARTYQRSEGICNYAYLRNPRIGAVRLAAA
ncbi:hypothetical protein THAOC_03885 [Thalassiosira oceanica]|uniref:Uncharacterized protein n=1 Tax=Thalassiosira oceanica TaxID=159749 RepID=K0T6L0_THAOC|nr:hypothetical protein THAOC_03885 [Thalassiosira oceanica]|eukprot:EJK74438.1 hypothetical protein THAOC_03885 [Thalassiosira oceanica]